MLTLNRAPARQLSKIATDAIKAVLLTGGPRSAPPWDEISAVKAVVLDGFDAIATGWQPVLAAQGYKLDLTAVFTHGRPQVGSTAGTCELADLLIVMDEKDASGWCDRRAVLVQAKLFKTGAIRLSSKEKVQFDLMFGWPSFTFKDPGYDKRPRNFHDPAAPGVAEHAGEYGGIELGSAPRQWDQLMMQNGYSFAADHPLGDYLVQMLQGHDAYGREATFKGADDWSFTVEELMRVTAAKGITKKSTILRGNSHSLRFMGLETSQLAILSTLVGDGGRDISGGHPDGDFWRDGPLSVVHLALSTEI